MKSSPIQRRAWELHRQNGHPKGYDGPCWGPTMEETAQAAVELELAKSREGDADDG